MITSRWTPRDHVDENEPEYHHRDMTMADACDTANEDGYELIFESDALTIWWDSADPALPLGFYWET